MSLPALPGRPPASATPDALRRGNDAVADIFLSYQSTDRDRAANLASHFEARGFTVWWDRQIPAGYEFDEVIGEALDNARCVVVMWSATSIKSRWVKEEAARGSKRDALVPILIDDVEPPLGFGRIEAANLADWYGQNDHVEFEQLIVSLASKVGKTDTHPAVRIADAKRDEMRDTPLPVAKSKPKPPAPVAAQASAKPAGAQRSVGNTIMTWTLILMLLAGGTAGVAFWKFEELPVSIRQVMSGHVREAQDELRAALTAEGATDSTRHAAFQNIAIRHEHHYNRDFDALQLDTIVTETARLRSALASRNVESLRDVVVDSTRSQHEILAALESARTEYGEILPAADMSFINGAIADVRPGAVLWDSIRTEQRAETLVVADELMRLQSFRETGAWRSGSPEDSVSSTRIAELDQVMRRLPHLITPSNFLACDDVVNRQCSPAASVFRARQQVYTWARVHSSVAQPVTFEWINDAGETVHSFDVDVSPSNGGWRVWGFHTPRSTGEYELRLYNRQRFLIGRRAIVVR